MTMLVTSLYHVPLQYILYKIKQVRKHPILSREDPGIVSAIAGVLAASQAYMRKREVNNNTVTGLCCGCKSI